MNDARNITLLDQEIVAEFMTRKGYFDRSISSRLSSPGSWMRSMAGAACPTKPGILTTGAPTRRRAGDEAADGQLAQLGAVRDQGGEDVEVKGEAPAEGVRQQVQEGGGVISNTTDVFVG